MSQDNFTRKHNHDIIPELHNNEACEDLVKSEEISDSFYCVGKPCRSINLIYEHSDNQEYLNKAYDILFEKVLLNRLRNNNNAPTKNNCDIC